MTSQLDSKLRFLGIEAGRGIAALIVVLVHATNILSIPKIFGTKAFSNAFVFGHAGVDFFFVLSGFVILYAHLSDLGRPSRLLNYAERRLTRIFPVYWIVTIAHLVVYLLSPTQTGRETRPDVVFKSILLFPQEGPPVVGVAWTLQYELLFYILFALLIFNRNAGMVVFGTWFTCVAAALFTGTHTFPLSFFLSVFNLHFGLGMLAAYLFRRYQRLPWLPATVVGGFLFGGTALLESLGVIDGHLPQFNLLYAAGSFFLILGIAEGERSGRFVVPSFLQRLGSASYSLYLIHVLVLLFVGLAYRLSGLNLRISAEVGLLLGTVITALLAIAFSERIEFPVIHWIRRHSRAYIYSRSA